MKCACCGFRIDGAHESRWGLPFCWRECIEQFQRRALFGGGTIESAVDAKRIVYGLRPLSDYGSETKAAAE